MTNLKIHKIIDRHNGFVIQKIVRPKGKVIYQTMLEASIGDGTASAQHGTLGEARKHIGMPAPSGGGTLPKSFYPQNQKGYDPHNARK